MKYPISAVLVFLSMGTYTETMDLKPKSGSQNKPEKFIPLSPKRKDSAEAKKIQDAMRQRETLDFGAKKPCNTQGKK